MIEYPGHPGEETDADTQVEGDDDMSVDVNSGV